MKRKIGLTVISILILLFGLFIFRCSLPDTPDETAPTTVIIFPEDGQAVSGTVKVVIGVSENEKIDHVSLFIDGEKVANMAEAPFEYTWDTAPIADNQDHSLQAVAVDEEGNSGFSGSTTVRVVTGTVPDTLAPVISIIHPVSGSTVKDTVPVTPQVFDESRVMKVEYYVDGFLNHTAQESPFVYNWDVSNYIDGSSHNLFAKAFDENLNSSFSTPVTVTVSTENIEDNTPPTIAILHPTGGSTVSGTVDILADPADNIGIQRLELFIDGQLFDTITQSPWKFSWDVSNLPNNSSHNIFIIAYDTGQNKTTSPIITVTVQSNNDEDNTPPSINIIYPVSGSEFSEGTIVTIRTDIQDESEIERVEFYIDGELLNTTTSTPYSYDWDTNGYGDGNSHSIYIKAFDVFGNVGTALTTVTITGGL